ncbi:MAG: PD-(D/E)XK nuclease family protein [Planctomycetota bacterium]
MKTKLTSTRLSSLRRCLRLHYYRYELGLARVRQATPLRFGQVFHKGLELRHGLFGQDTQALLDNVLADYGTAPAWADPTDWAVEHQTLRALLTGHLWRYGSDNVTFVAVEQAFEIPLVNPGTGYPSRKFALAGKIDGVVQLPDGRLAVLEYKTTSEDVAQGGEYWLRLRCDGQISQYVLAARALGFDVATVLYDVTRKPTIRLRQNETPEQYGQRLLADIGERPDYYYQRREVPRLEDELALYRAELWQQAQHLIELRRRAARLADPTAAHFRNVGKITCGQCEFANLCLNGIRVTPDSPPAGYQVLPDVNPELGLEAA